VGSEVAHRLRAPEILEESRQPLYVAVTPVLTVTRKKYRRSAADAHLTPEVR
jgi:hypothetical protein